MTRLEMRNLLKDHWLWWLLTQKYHFARGTISSTYNQILRLIWPSEGMSIATSKKSDDPLPLLSPSAPIEEPGTPVSIAQESFNDPRLANEICYLNESMSYSDPPLLPPSSDLKSDLVSWVPWMMLAIFIGLLTLCGYKSFIAGIRRRKTDDNNLLVTDTVTEDTFEQKVATIEKSFQDKADRAETSMTRQALTIKTSIDDKVSAAGQSIDEKVLAASKSIDERRSTIKQSVLQDLSPQLSTLVTSSLHDAVKLEGAAICSTVSTHINLIAEFSKRTLYQGLRSEVGRQLPNLVANATSGLAEKVKASLNESFFPTFRKGIVDDLRKDASESALNIEARFKAIEEKQNVLSKKNKALETENSTLKNECAANATAMKTLGENIINLKSEVGALTKTAQMQHGLIGALKKETGAITSKFTSLEASFKLVTEDLQFQFGEAVANAESLERLVRQANENIEISQQILDHDQSLLKETQTKLEEGVKFAQAAADQIIRGKDNMEIAHKKMTEDNRAAVEASKEALERSEKVHTETVAGKIAMEEACQIVIERAEATKVVHAKILTESKTIKDGYAKIIEDNKPATNAQGKRIDKIEKDLGLCVASRTSNQTAFQKINLEHSKLWKSITTTSADVARLNYSHEKRGQQDSKSDISVSPASSEENLIAAKAVALVSQSTRHAKKAAGTSVASEMIVESLEKGSVAGENKHAQDEARQTGEADAPEIVEDVAQPNISEITQMLGRVSIHPVSMDHVEPMAENTKTSADTDIITDGPSADSSLLSDVSEKVEKLERPCAGPSYILEGRADDHPGKKLNNNGRRSRQKDLYEAYDKGGAKFCEEHHVTRNRRRSISGGESYVDLRRYPVTLPGHPKPQVTFVSIEQYRLLSRQDQEMLKDACGFQLESIKVQKVSTREEDGEGAVKTEIKDESGVELEAAAPPFTDFLDNITPGHLRDACFSHHARLVNSRPATALLSALSLDQALIVQGPVAASLGDNAVGSIQAEEKDSLERPAWSLNRPGWLKPERRKACVEKYYQEHPEVLASRKALAEPVILGLPPLSSSAIELSREDEDNSIKTILGRKSKVEFLVEDPSVYTTWRTKTNQPKTEKGQAPKSTNSSTPSSVAISSTVSQPSQPTPSSSQQNGPSKGLKTSRFMMTDEELEAARKAREPKQSLANPDRPAPPPVQQKEPAKGLKTSRFMMTDEELEAARKAREPSQTGMKSDHPPFSQDKRQKLIQPHLTQQSHTHQGVPHHMFQAPTIWEPAAPRATRNSNPLNIQNTAQSQNFDHLPLQNNAPSATVQAGGLLGTPTGPRQRMNQQQQPPQWPGSRSAHNDGVGCQRRR